MKYLTLFSLVMVIVGVLIVESNCQCSYTDMDFIKQLVLREMFERRRDIITVRSVQQTLEENSKDIHARFERLEQQFFEFENITREKIEAQNASVDDIKAVVEQSKTSITELQSQFKEHYGDEEDNDSQLDDNGDVGQCPDDKWKRYGEKCYSFTTQPQRSWFDAREACRDFKGELVGIEDKEENDFISSIVNTSELLDDYWIGLERTQTEHIWHWSSLKGNQSLDNFTNWGPGEPNDGFGTEDCGEIVGHSGQWNDRTCSRKLSFICETVPHF